MIRDHRIALLFVFSELDNVAAKTLNIEKPVLPPLAMVNVDDATPSKACKPYLREPPRLPWCSYQLP